MGKAIAELNSKIKTLSFRLGKTDEIIEKSDEEALKRHKTSITNITSMVDTLKEAVEGKKFAEFTVREWSTISAYVMSILELPHIKERDVMKIQEFYDSLLFNVESLQTLKKLNEIDAAVRFTLDKLSIIKPELVLLDENWSEWNFKNFVEI